MPSCHLVQDMYPLLHLPRVTKDISIYAVYASMAAFGSCEAAVGTDAWLYGNTLLIRGTYITDGKRCRTTNNTTACIIHTG